MKHLLIILTLTLFLAGTVAGQSMATKPRTQTDKTGAISAMFAPGVSMLGLQPNAGTYDFLNDKCWGNTFVLNGSGEWFTSHLTITMDYVSGIANPEKGNVVTFGTWTMTIYKENAYFGTVYGEVAEGNLAWWVSPKTGLIEKRNTDIVLRVLGTLDGMTKLWEEPVDLRLNADTRFDGTRAVTTATLIADY